MLSLPPQALVPPSYGLSSLRLSDSAADMMATDDPSSASSTSSADSSTWHRSAASSASEASPSASPASDMAQDLLKHPAAPFDPAAELPMLSHKYHVLENVVRQAGMPPDSTPCPVLANYVLQASPPRSPCSPSSKRPAPCSFAASVWPRASSIVRYLDARYPTHKYRQY